MSLRMSPTIVVVREAQRLLVCVSGELDLASRAQLESRCASIRPERTDLVLDLTGLTFVDCGSLRVLTRLARSFAERGRRPRIVVPAGPVARIIAVAGFFDGFDLSVTPPTTGEHSTACRSAR
jgi:anti-anti-sigma factor